MSASVAPVASLMNESAAGVQGGQWNEEAYGKSVHTGVPMSSPNTGFDWSLRSAPR